MTRGSRLLLSVGPQVRDSILGEYAQVWAEWPRLRGWERWLAEDEFPSDQFTARMVVAGGYGPPHRSPAPGLRPIAKDTFFRGRWGEPERPGSAGLEKQMIKRGGHGAPIRLAYRLPGERRARVYSDFGVMGPHDDHAWLTPGGHTFDVSVLDLAGVVRARRSFVVTIFVDRDAPLQVVEA